MINGFADNSDKPPSTIVARADVERKISSTSTPAAMQQEATNGSSSLVRKPTITINHMAEVEQEASKAADKKSSAAPHSPKKISFQMDAGGGGSGNGCGEKAAAKSLTSDASNSASVSMADEGRKMSGGSASSPCSICDASSQFSASRSGEDDDDDDEDDEEEDDDDIVQVEVEKCNGGVPAMVKSTSKDMIAKAMAFNPTVLWHKNKNKANSSNLSATLPRSASSSSTRLIENSSGAASVTDSPRHMVTYVTSSMETIPVEINQDIPDVAL